ncbi:MAG: hypothetical protein STSR0002_12750 [Smithella sp.]
MTGPDALGAMLAKRNKIGLLKKVHLLCYAASRAAQRIFIYASRCGFLRAWHLNIFEQPSN